MKIKINLKRKLFLIVSIIFLSYTFAFSIDHFTIDSCPSKVTQSVPFSFTITARNGAEIDSEYYGNVYVWTDDKWSNYGDLPSTTVFLREGTADVTDLILNSPGTNKHIYVMSENDGSLPPASISLEVERYIDHFEFSDLPPQTAGQSFNLTITAKDINNNTVTLFKDNIILEAEVGDIEPVSIPGNQFINGVATANITLYGAYPSVPPGNDPTSEYKNRITVKNTQSYDGNPAVESTTPYINVEPERGSFKNIVLLFPGETITPGQRGSLDGKEGTPNSGVSGMAFKNVMVVATDSYWNPVKTGPYPTITFTTTDTSGEVMLPPANTNMTFNTSIFNNITLITSGLIDITVNAPVTGKGNRSSTSRVEIGSAGLDHFEFNHISDQNTIDEFPVTINAKDKANNTVINYTGTCELSCELGAGVIYPTSITFNAGVWNGNVHITRQALGGTTITVDDGAGHTGRSNTFNIAPGAFSKFVVVLPGQSITQGVPPGYAGTTPAIKVGDTVDVTVYSTDVISFKKIII